MSRYRYTSSALIVCLVLGAAQPAFAATYRESAEYSTYVKELTDKKSGEVVSEVGSNIVDTITNCTEAGGMVAFTGTVDSIPLIGAAKLVSLLLLKAALIIQKLSEFLHLNDFVTKTFSTLLTYLDETYAKVKQYTPGGEGKLDAIYGKVKEILAHPWTSNTAKGATTAGVSGERIAGPAIGIYASDKADQKTWLQKADQAAATGVEVVGPHILGGAISALVDYLLFEAVSATGRATGIDSLADRSPMPKGSVTREAYRMTILAATEGFSDSSSCKISYAKTLAAFDEALARSDMMKRPPTAAGANTKSSLGQLPTSSSAALLPNQGPAITSRMHPAAVRPHGSPDNGGRDFAPAPAPSAASASR